MLYIGFSKARMMWKKLYILLVLHVTVVTLYITINTSYSFTTVNFNWVTMTGINNRQTLTTWRNEETIWVSPGTNAKPRQPVDTILNTPRTNAIFRQSIANTGNTTFFGAKDGERNINVVRNMNPNLNFVTMKQRNLHKTTRRKPTYKTGVFQAIDRTDAWVYSAHFDHVAAINGKPLVRVFGVANNKYLTSAYCTFTYENGSIMSTGQLNALPDYHKRKYPCSYLDCVLPNKVHPTHVSVSFQPTDKPTNRLQVSYPTPQFRNLTVCYSVLHSHFNKASELITSIEINRILGAQHFVVYNYSVSPQVDLILQRYQKDGLLTILPWPIPTFHSWYYAQMAAVNDCFYRNRNSTKFIVVVDTDEIITPKHHNTWMEVIENVTRQLMNHTVNFLASTKNNETQIGSFIFRSSKFTINSTTKWDSLPPGASFTELKDSILKYKIIPLSQFWRSTFIYPHEVQSKYIARPELVDIAGIHYVQRFVTDNSSINVSENLVLVHHYRKEDMDQVVQDFSFLKYAHKLYHRLMQQYKVFDSIFS